MKFWLSLLSDIATELEGEGVKDLLLPPVISKSIGFNY